MRVFASACCLLHDFLLTVLLGGLILSIFITAAPTPFHQLPSIITTKTEAHA